MSEAGLPAPFRLISLDSVASTNDEARRLASTDAAADCLVVTAKTQTAGRGRGGRRWESPAGNLHMSILVRRFESPILMAQLGFVVSLAVAEALETLLPGVEFLCKWPNDVYCGARKLAGMLLEPVDETWNIVGIGVDVVTAPPLGQTLYASGCLGDMGYSGDARMVAIAICRSFGPWLERWRMEGLAPVRSAWLKRVRGLGEPVVVRSVNDTLSGRFAGLDADGALLLEEEAGSVRRIMAGDVFFPRLGA